MRQITDRAKRYRANRIHKLRNRCEQCGSKRNLGVGHRDGDESNNRPSNLFTQCKACNGKQAARDKKAGRGVRTRQYNPTHLWEMTLAEYRSSLSGKRIKHGGYYSRSGQIESDHDSAVEHAIQARHAVPQKVLDDLFRRYPYRRDQFVRIYGRPNPGDINLAQYVQAAMDHVRGSHDAAGKVLHETPKSVRREFAKEIWWRRGYRGNPPEDIMPEFWAGKLRDSHGRIVRSKTQAKAILLSELRALGKIPARKNPSEADTLYKKFHGRGPDKIYEMQVAGIDPYGGHPELTSLGPLIRFIVGEDVELGGQYGDEVQQAEWVREISFVPSVARWHEWLERTDPPVQEAKAKLREWGTPDLAQVPADPRKQSRGQLYIVGGKYEADAAALGVDPDKDLWDLGNVYLVEYFTQKRFDRFELINYFHAFSEKSKQDWPRLIYNKPSHFLSLAGGDYSVTSRGIEN